MKLYIYLTPLKMNFKLLSIIAVHPLWFMQLKNGGELYGLFMFTQQEALTSLD